MLKTTYDAFEKSLHDLLKKAKQKPVSFKTLLTALHGRGKLFLLIILSMGFAQIPGIAIFFGLLIAYFGIRVITGNSHIWLPKFLVNKKIPSWVFTAFIPLFLKFLKFMKRFSHPRYTWATQSKSSHVVNGIMLILLGISMAISPPVPFSGWIACLAIFFLAIGLFNDDGVYVIIGIGNTIFYLTAVILMLKFTSVCQMIEWSKMLKDYLC